MFDGGRPGNDLLDGGLVPGPNGLPSAQFDGANDLLIGGPGFDTYVIWYRQALSQGQTNNNPSYHDVFDTIFDDFDADRAWGHWRQYEFLNLEGPFLLGEPLLIGV